MAIQSIHRIVLAGGCRGLVVGVLLFSLWLLQLPLWCDLFVALAVGVAGFFSSLVNLSFLATGISIAVGIVYAFFSLTSENYRQYYREHEEFARPGLIYQSNVSKTIHQPHGDLLAIDPTLPSEIKEARDVEFVTDSRGYRNRSDYSGEDHLLFGDSFLVGNGVTQSRTLPEVLRTRYDLPVYSLAHPQDPLDYERRAAWALEEFGGDKKLSFFFYEGNDFVDSSNLNRGAADINQRYDDFRLRALHLIVGSSKAPTTLYKLIKQAERRFIGTNTELTTLGYSGSLQVGHFTRQTEAAFFTNPDVVLDLSPQVWARTVCAFFIPTKARLYPESLPRSNRMLANPPPAFVKLKQVLEPLGIRVVDLTPVLVSAKSAALDDGRLLFWRDDTHWNDAGIAAVAPIVADCLKTGGLPSSQRVDSESDLKVKTEVDRLTVGNTSYRLSSSDLTGFVESTSKNAHSAVLAGWAGSRAVSNKPVVILVVDGDRIIGKSLGRSPRPDTARILGENSKWAGFAVAVPVQSYEKSRAELRVIVLSGGQANVLEVAKA